MNKILERVMVIVMMVCLLAACAPQPTVTTVPAPTATSTVAPAATATVAPAAPATVAPAEPDSGVTIPSNLPKKKIGMSRSTFSDSLGILLKTNLESFAGPFNVEFMFVEFGNSMEGAQAGLESMLQADLDGMLMELAGEAAIAAVDQAGVPMVVSGSISADELKAVSKYSNFLGNIGIESYYVGLNAADALYAAGCRNVGVVGLTAGLVPEFDARRGGFIDGVAKHPDMKIIAEDLSMGQFDKGVQTFAASFPEMDGIFAEVATDAIYQAILTNGLIGKVKMAGIEVFEMAGTFFDNGTLVYLAGGQQQTNIASFAVLYNYLFDGTRLISDTSQMILTNYIEVKSSTEFDMYKKLVDGTVPVYTPEEMAAMIVGFNPSFTPDDYARLLTQYTLEDVAKRHADLLK